MHTIHGSLSNHNLSGCRRRNDAWAIQSTFYFPGNHLITSALANTYSPCPSDSPTSESSPLPLYPLCVFTSCVSVVVARICQDVSLQLNRDLHCLMICLNNSDCEFEISPAGHAIRGSRHRKSSVGWVDQVSSGITLLLQTTHANMFE